MTHHDNVAELQSHASGILRRLVNREQLADPAYAYQVAVTEQALRTLVEALFDSEVHSSIAMEVVQKFVFGMVPSDVQAQLTRTLVNERIAELENSPLRAAVVTHSGLNDAFRDAAGEGRA